MVSDLTESPHPTCSWTGVDTLLGDAGQSRRAVTVVKTLSSAALRRHGVSLESSPAGAENLPSSVLTAVGVGAAGRGLAGVDRDTALVRVTVEARVTLAVLSAVENVTHAVLSTRSGLTERYVGQCGFGCGEVDGDTALDGVD